MERCCCGNPLREHELTIRISPCKCEKPGPHKRQMSMCDIPYQVPEKQILERRALGAPILTNIEKHAYSKWW